jgi:hypothetical protein
VFPAAGRVIGPDGTYSGFLHLILLVQPHAAPHADVTYLIDVGLGGTGPIRPILFSDGSSGNPQRGLSTAGATAGGWVWGAYPPERHRILRGTFTDGSLGPPVC